MRVVGAEAIVRKLRVLPENVAERELRRAARAAAEPIRARMEALAPRGDPAEPTLANIVVTPVRGSDPMAAAVWIGPSRDAYYGYFQEYGTRYHAAQPFARPAFDSEHDEAQRVLQHEIWDTFVEALR